MDGQRLAELERLANEVQEYLPGDWKADIETDWFDDYSPPFKYCCTIDPVISFMEIDDKIDNVLLGQFIAASREAIPDLIAEIRRLQSELANAKIHAEVQAGQAREAVYTEVLELIYDSEITSLIGVVEAVKGLRDKVQAEPAGKE